MSYLERMNTEFQKVLKDFHNSPAMQRALSGKLTIEHYKSTLREISHYTRENPQIQAMATIYFRGHQRASVKGFYKHATSEIGHDQLALNDLKVLGDDPSLVPFQNPLPNTVSLIAFPYFQIQNLNPVGYLGYLYFLEFTPTQAGKAYKEALQSMGVPDTALTFLHDHTTIDVGHNKLMKRYFENLVTNEAEFDSCVYAMKVTGHLYALMLQGAFDQVNNPKDYGMSSVEMNFKKEIRQAVEAA